MSLYLETIYIGSFLQLIVQHVVEQLLPYSLTLFTSWPSVILIIFLLIKNPICAILDALASTIKRIQEVRFKELRLLLQSKDVPSEAKIALTKYFVERTGDIKKAIEVLARSTQSLRKLVSVIKEVSTNTRGLHEANRNAIYDLEELYTLLLLLPRSHVVLDKSVIIKSVIEELRKEPANIGQSAYPAIDGLSKLDPAWRDKDSSDFKHVKELQELLIALLQNSYNSGEK